MKKQILEKFCYKCGIVRIPKGRQVYCGSEKRKTGCSYAMKLIRAKDYNKKFREKHPNYYQEVKLRMYQLGRNSILKQ